MAASDKPNILFIMSDDVGWFNVSCYNHGIMGYRTPNIDRTAAEGTMFTDVPTPVSVPQVQVLNFRPGIPITG